MNQFFHTSAQAVLPTGFAAMALQGDGAADAQLSLLLVKDSLTVRLVPGPSDVPVDVIGDECDAAGAVSSAGISKDGKMVFGIKDGLITVYVVPDTAGYALPAAAGSSWLNKDMLSALAGFATSVLRESRGSATTDDDGFVRKMSEEVKKLLPVEPPQQVGGPALEVVARLQVKGCQKAAWSHDGRRLAIACKGAVYVHDLATHTNLALRAPDVDRDCRTLVWYNDCIFMLKRADSNVHEFFNVADGAIELWKTMTPVPEVQLRAFSSDGRVFSMGALRVTDETATTFPSLQNVPCVV